MARLPWQRPASLGSGNPLRVARGKNALMASAESGTGGKSETLTASGQRVVRRDADSLRRLAMPWQSRAFAYYNTLGEIKYAATFYSRMLSPLRLYPGYLNDAGEVEETNNAVAVEQLKRIQDPGGGRTGLLSSYGKLMFLAGEAYLLCTIDPDTGQEQWEMLSQSELRLQGGVYTRYRAPSLGAEEYREPNDDDFEPLDDKTAVVYRLWKRHPEFSALADSTMQGVLDLCEELIVLTQAVRSRARSRLAGSGILLIDENISPPPLEAVGDEDPQVDPFLQDLTEAMTTPIVDEGAASAVVPLVVRAPLESIKDGVRLVQIIDPMQFYPETGLRRECIERISIGLDMPPEILTGFLDANHWTGWMIDEQTWKGHGQPLAQQLVDDLTAAYYRPSLRKAGLADWERYCVAYDPAAVVNHPDRSKNAKDLYEAGAVGVATVRDASGFDESDAMTAEERQEWLGIRLRDSQLAVTGVPRESGISTPGLEPDDGDGDGTAAGTERKPPEEPERADEPLPETVVGTAVAGQILGAADVALLRAREAAGNRLRTLARRDSDVAELIEGVAPGQVAATLGPDRVKALRAPTAPELVSGARELLLEALRGMGVRDVEIARQILDRIEQHAARTLYEEKPGPLPPSFRNYVRGVAKVTAR